MKYFKILTIVLLTSVISFYACSDNADTKKQESRESLKVQDSPTVPIATTPITTTPNATTPNKATPAAQNSQGVWHYSCNNGCAGGAGGAGNCSNCGGPLAHNVDYHAKGNNNASTTQTSPLVKPLAKPPTASAQNAAGVWHYTCGQGCAGGSGALGNCGSCGSPLVHNTLYH